MESDLRERADRRLAAAFEAAAMMDARAGLRERLRDLRARAPDAFDRALAHYEASVLPVLADGDDVLSAWVEYGLFVGSLDGPGRALSIDDSGRATPYSPPAARDRLTLFLPDDAARPALLLASPAQPTGPQAAALGLLIEARLTL